MRFGAWATLCRRFASQVHHPQTSAALLLEPVTQMPGYLHTRPGSRRIGWSLVVSRPGGKADGGRCCFDGDGAEGGLDRRPQVGSTSPLGIPSVPFCYSLKRSNPSSSSGMLRSADVRLGLAVWAGAFLGLVDPAMW